MRKKMFLRRGVKYFLLMLVPTILLFSIFMVNAVQTQEKVLRQDGQSTLEAAADNCVTAIQTVAEQNNLITGSSRMLMSLQRMLTADEISYIDSAFLYSLRTMLSSMTEAHQALSGILIWLDDAPRAFTSEGSGIQYLSAMTDREWMDVYLSMPQDESSRMYASTDAAGKRNVTVIRRLLLKKGCTVVTINADQWADNLLSLLHRTNEHLILLNRQGEVLLHVTNDDQATGLLSADLSSVSSDGDWITIGSEKFMVSRTEAADVTILAVIPVRTMIDSTADLRTTFLAVLLADIVVVLVLAWVTTRQITSQMYRVIDMFDDALHGRPVQKPESKRKPDESDIIMDNIVYMYLKDNALQSRIQEETLRKENAELMALQLQINPHFLYNTLQTMDFAILSGKADKQDLSDVFHDLSSILKYALSNPQEPVTLSDELECLRKYADIQRYRFGNRFVMYIEIDDELMNAQVFRMMLQPLVENSMIHGLNGLKERGHIWVRAEREGDRLTVSVTDSGVGMTEDERTALLEKINSDKSRSIGLTNLNRRLILHFGRESALQISSIPLQETTVRFTIPYRDAAQET